MTAAKIDQSAMTPEQLGWIATVNACDYEYVAKARTALKATP